MAVFLRTIAAVGQMPIWANAHQAARGRRRASPLYSDAKGAAVACADASTLSDRDLNGELFARARRFYGDDARAELAAVIAW